MADNTVSHDCTTALAVAPPVARERNQVRPGSGRIRRFVTRFGSITAALCLLVAGAVYYGVFSDHAGWWAPGEPVAPGDHTAFALFTLGVTALALFGAGLGLLCALATPGPVIKLVWATVAALTVLAILRSNLDVGAVLHQMFPTRGPSA
jgi:hypothetical protein